jgi:Ca2+-binding RTX toxin-like protein
MVIADGADAANTDAQTVSTTAAALEILATATVVGAIATTPGVDSIDGGAGADTIVGGGGADVITGGAGIDVIYFAKEMSNLSNLVTLTDYRAATGDNAGALDTLVITNQVAAAGTIATVQDLSTSASLGAALNAAANSNTQNIGLSVFMWGGNTYAYVETTGADTTFTTSDFLVKITGTTWTTATAIAGLGFDGV